MTVKSDIEQGVRDWLKAAGNPPTGGALGAPLTDNQVILADKPGPRPTSAYLSVKVTVPAAVIGMQDERIDTLDGGTPQVSIRGARRATVSVNAFGETAIEWLAMAVLGLPLPPIMAIVDAAGLTIDTFGDPIDLSLVLDTAFEARVLHEFEVQYRLDGAPVDAVEALTAEIDYTADGGGPAGALNRTITIDTT